MTQTTYQVDMNNETYAQLENPGLTYLSREEAKQAIQTVLTQHGRCFTIDENGDVISFLNERGGSLATIRAVRATGQTPG